MRFDGTHFLFYLGYFRQLSVAGKEVGATMRIYAAKDYNDMSRKAANLISAQVIMKPDAVLGLATGSTPVGAYGIAERIYQYDEVESMYLMSGSFDLTVIISGRTLREVAQFVGERLAPIQGVTGTATHFILKKYKEKHLVFRPQDPEEREYIFV